MLRLTILALLMLLLVLSPAPITHALEPAAPAACSTIPELQGSGNSSPCEGHRDNIAGCITGVTAAGIFLQDLAGNGDTTTSNGIYAYVWASWTNPTTSSPATWSAWLDDCAAVGLQEVEGKQQVWDGLAAAFKQPEAPPYT